MMKADLPKKHTCYKIWTAACETAACEILCNSKYVMHSELQPVLPDEGWITYMLYFNKHLSKPLDCP